MRRPLIVVSNRGPVAYARTGAGERVARRGGGGLATALRGLSSRQEVTWIASAMNDEDRAVAAESAGGSVSETGPDGSSYRLHLLAHEPAAYDAYYSVVANPALWFVQHHLYPLAYEPAFDAAFRSAWEDGYAAVNAAFADAVIADLDRRPDAAVFFHDYHLYLAPRLVRRARPDATLTHFVHIPWPEADAWHVLPADLRLAVHDGLLANDVVAFHTARWRRNFVRSAADVAGATPDGPERLAYAGRSVRAIARPASADPAEFARLASAEPVLAAERDLISGRPELLILRVDRTDPSKNVVRGFQAFGLLLERHPELVGRVGMLALLDPSRQDIPAYADYLDAVRREAAAVNERFGAGGRPPIELQVADDFHRSVAAYKQFDVLLVNAVYDGLNLVAKEAPLVNVRSGVLVLSENAGAHEELGEWALTVNPFDVSAQADALHRALVMPAADRAQRAEAIRAHVHRHDLAAWIDALLAEIDAVAPATG